MNNPVSSWLAVLLRVLLVLYTAAAFGSSQLSSPNQNEQAKALEESVRSADLVFVGRITALGPLPTYESGRGIAFREVEYLVLELLKGDLEDQQVTVRHLGGPGSKFLHELSFDRELIVFARFKQSVYWAASSYKGAVPATDNMLAKVKQLTQ